MTAPFDRETLIQNTKIHVILMANEKDLAVRRQMVEKTYVPTVTLYAPDGTHKGYDQLLASLDGFLAAFPEGCVFQERGPTQVKEDLATQAWQLGKLGEEPLLTGADVCIFQEDGRIVKAYILLDEKV